MAQERPLLLTLQNVHGTLSSHHLLTPAFMGFSFFFAPNDLLPLALDLIPSSSAAVGLCLKTHFCLVGFEHP